MNEATQWLRWLYGDQPDGLIWIGGHGDGFAGRTFIGIDDAVSYAAALDAGAAGGVYHRLTTLRDIERGRGTAADSAYLPAFAMDLDLRGPGHKALNYPEQESDLHDLLTKAGLPEPTAWVHSGGGRYPFWKLEQPLDLTLPGQLERAALLSSRLHKHVMGWAAELGWKVDNTSDLARVYRLPGTLNRKSDPALACVVQSMSGAAVTMEQMEQSVTGAPSPGVPEQAASPFSTQSESVLFGDPSAFDRPREYTARAAMEFVRPSLEALRQAVNGEINSRLVAAAMAFAHFGTDFWEREVAERELHAALAATVYDGATWKAQDTIDHAFADMASKSGVDYWHAVHVPELEPSSIPGTEISAASKADWLFGQLVSAEQMAALPAPVPLVYGMLDMNTESWLIGEPGSFKSFVALDLAAHVGGGREWQRHRVRQGEVLYLAAEGAGGMTLRARAWQQRYGQMSGVHFLPLPLQVSNVEEWAALVEVCRRLMPVLIVIDTQARVTRGLDENTSKDAGLFIGAFTQLKAVTGACVLVVHHTGRDGKNARGSSAIDGAQDSELKLLRKDRASMRVIIRDDKQKDMAENSEGTELKLQAVDLGTDPETERALSSLVVLPHSAWQEQEQGPDAEPVPGQEKNVPDPEAWTWRLVEHHSRHTQRQTLQALASVAGQIGITETAVRAVVLARWYDGRPMKAKRSGHLDPGTWHDSWTAVRGLKTASGDPLLVNEHHAERWAINPEVMSGLE